MRGGALRYIGWSVTIAAAVIYLVMIVVSLPHLAALAGGEAVFDLRPLGYDFATAQELLARLGSDGAAYYENVQHRLDALFPVLSCLAVVYWQIVFGRIWQGRGLPLSGAVLAAILAATIVGAAADLGENAAVSAMLAVGPKGLTPGLVEIANRFTLAKTFFDSVGYAALMVLGLWPLIVQALGRRS